MIFSIFSSDSTPARRAYVARCSWRSTLPKDGAGCAKRDTTPDAIGLPLKRQLLIRAVEADPDPNEFEAWLLDRCLARIDRGAVGALQAMAREVIAEWRV